MTTPDAFITDEQRWRAVTLRTERADTAFVYAVATTSIYCRPTCPSRKPSRKNVRFFDDWKIAELNGFRPCKRCAPRLSGAIDIGKGTAIRACALIDAAGKEPSLRELASAVGLSPFHFHRTFKKVLGITPKQYAIESRLKRMRENLPQSASVTDAVYESGYESSSRFYERGTERLGMKPAAYKRGGKGKTVFYAIVPVSLGWALIAATERGLCGMEFDDSPEALRRKVNALFPEAELRENPPEFKAFVERTVEFLEGPDRGAPLPLDIQGTAFQVRVWAELRKIPRGSTVNYGEIAKRLGEPKASRAVARACAANKIAVAIPCHRVVRGDGGLGGYRWGVDRKRRLLEDETNDPE